MSFSQADLDALDVAIKSGVARVKYADKEVEYRDLAEIKELRALMAKEINGTKVTSGRIYTNHDKGICR